MTPPQRAVARRQTQIEANSRDNVGNILWICNCLPEIELEKIHLGRIHVFRELHWKHLYQRHW